MKKYIAIATVAVMAVAGGAFVAKAEPATSSVKTVIESAAQAGALSTAPDAAAPMAPANAPAAESMPAMMKPPAAPVTSADAVAASAAKQVAADKVDCKRVASTLKINGKKPSVKEKADFIKKCMDEKEGAATADMKPADAAPAPAAAPAPKVETAPVETKSDAMPADAAPKPDAETAAPAVEAPKAEDVTPTLNDSKDAE